MAESIAYWGFKKMRFCLKTTGILLGMLSLQNCAPYKSSQDRVVEELTPMEVTEFSSQPSSVGFKPNAATSTSTRTLLVSFNRTINGSARLYLRSALAGKVDTYQYQVRSVRIQAKSMYGAGKSRMLIGNSQGSIVNVPGNPTSFMAGGNFADLNLPQPSASASDMAGGWQVLLSGTIKVQSAIIVLVPKAAAAPVAPPVNPPATSPAFGGQPAQLPPPSGVDSDGRPYWCVDSGGGDGPACFPYPPGPGDSSSGP